MNVIVTLSRITQLLFSHFYNQQIIVALLSTPILLPAGLQFLLNVQQGIGADTSTLADPNPVT